MKSKQEKSEFYLGSENLPTPDATFEYTPQMIKEIKKCSKDIVHFAQNYFFITSLEHGKQKINLYAAQKRLVKSLVKNRFVVTLASRQIGKTTIMTIYALWNTCFNGDQRVLIVANKEDTAIMILRRIRLAYEQLPNWLKPGIKQWGKTEVVFGNDSSISISTTTSSAARGESCNVLIIDEMAFIPEHIMQEFWNSVIPIVSSGLSTKVFVVSTPNGSGNMFHQIYIGAERKDPKLSQWHHERIDWWEVPGRGKKWQLAMESALVGQGKSFAQEFGNEFLESGQSAVDGELLNHFRSICRTPAILLKDGKYSIWEPPNENNLYVIGVDVCEGIGQAASVAQVLDITDLTNIKQVACFHDNTIDPFHFSTVIFEMAHQWGKPQLLIERNNCGGTVIDTLKEVHNYHNIVDYTPENQKYYNKLGIYSHTNAKYNGVMNMRYWLNSLRAVTIYDIALVQELETFVKYPNGTWKKQKGDYIYDDRVMALIWGLLILMPELTERYFDIASYDTNGKPKRIKPFNITPPEYFKLDKFYQTDPYAPVPTFIGVDPGGGDDISELEKQGWRIPYGRYNR